jgi:tetratricopeptide (TPR) repeat protein
MIRRKGLILLFAILFAARPGLARESDATERAAKTACLSGDYAKGVAILSELYVSTNNPAFLFNQGRCYEQNHRYEDAISRFQEYLRVGKRLTKADKADAQKHISDCQDLLAKQARSQVASGSASASGGDKESRERAAMKACLTGDAAAGVALLTDLFIDTKDTTYLFNQGRCFEQNRRYEEAIGRFREYLIKTKNLRPEDKADTEKHIAACESYLQTKGTPTAKPEPPTAVVERPPVVESKPAQVVVVPATPSPVRAGSGLRTAGVVVAAVGAAGVVTGLVLNLKANSMSRDLENLYDPSVDSSRKSYESGTWIAYGAGAACLVGGAVLYLLGWRSGASTASVALVPTVGPEMAGTALRGRF